MLPGMGVALATDWLVLGNPVFIRESGYFAILPLVTVGKPNSLTSVLARRQQVLAAGILESRASDGAVMPVLLFNQYLCLH